MRWKFSHLGTFKNRPHYPAQATVLYKNVSTERVIALKRIFWGFCINLFGICPLYYVSSRSDFGFEFPEIFVIEKGLPDWANRGVDYSPTRGVGESAFECLKENSASQRVGDSPTRRVGELFWLRMPGDICNWKNDSQTRRIVESTTRRAGESAFEKKFGESESRQLPDSASRRVVFRLRISPRIWSQKRNG